MKIYFAGSIRGGRDDTALYAQIIALLSNYGTVLTEHISHAHITALGETERTDKEIYERDIGWLFESDVIVAEVTTPSLGVGYEIAKAEDLGKKVICLHRKMPGKRISAMISGCPNITLVAYRDISDLEKTFSKYLNRVP